MSTTFAGETMHPLMALRRQTSGTVAFDGQLVARLTHCTVCGTPQAGQDLYAGHVEMPHLGVMLIAVCPACRRSWTRLAPVVRTQLEARYGP